MNYREVYGMLQASPNSTLQKLAFEYPVYLPNKPPNWDTMPEYEQSSYVQNQMHTLTSGEYLRQEKQRKDRALEQIPTTVAAVGIPFYDVIVNTRAESPDLTKTDTLKQLPAAVASQFNPANNPQSWAPPVLQNAANILYNGARSIPRFFTPAKYEAAFDSAIPRLPYVNGGEGMPNLMKAVEGAVTGIGLVGGAGLAAKSIKNIVRGAKARKLKNLGSGTFPINSEEALELANTKLDKDLKAVNYGPIEYTGPDDGKRWVHFLNNHPSNAQAPILVDPKTGRTTLSNVGARDPFTRNIKQWALLKNKNPNMPTETLRSMVGNRANEAYLPSYPGYPIWLGKGVFKSPELSSIADDYAANVYSRFWPNTRRFEYQDLTGKPVASYRMGDYGKVLDKIKQKLGISKVK